MYDVRYSQEIEIFAEENNIVISDILKEYIENIKTFPYMYPPYDRHGVICENFLVTKISERNLEILYVVYEQEKIIIIKDICFLKSSVKLKIR